MADRGQGLIGRLRVTEWFALAAAVLGVATLIGIAAGVVAVVRLADARSEVVDRLDPAATAALRLSNALINEESGVRGFAIAREPGFLDPYRAGRREEQAATRALHRLLAETDEPQLVADLRRVERRATLWRSEYALPTVARVARGEAPRGAARGKRLFDRVRAALRAQEANLVAARAEGRERLAGAARFLSLSFAAIAVLLVLAVVAVTVALRRIVARPLVRLAEEAREVARGDFEHELERRGPRDIAELSGDVDSMRRRIVEELVAIRAANERLDRQAQELERSNAELEQFAYVASHDLQEPLRKVASFCQLLEQRYKGQLDERADQYIGFAVDGAKRMQQLINDLLAFSRVGRVSGELEEIELDAVVTRAVANLQAAIEESKAVVRWDDMPRVRGEATLLTAVFQNLIGNAIKFRSDAPPEVRIGVERRDGEWLFSCRDNGIGIAPEYAERVFVIFQRLHAKDRYAGTGIGLAMCRKIVEYHGGRIWLGTAVDHGTVFNFTLPALEEEPHERPE